MVEFADVHGRQNGKHSALQNGDEVLESNQCRQQAAHGECRGEGSVEGQREGQGQTHAGQDMQQRVPGEHIDPKSDTQGDRPEAVRDGLERDKDEGHGPGRSPGNEMPREGESEL